MLQYFYNRFTIGGKFLGLILPFGVTTIIIMVFTYYSAKKMSIEGEAMSQIMATAELNSNVRQPSLFIIEPHHEIKEGLLIEEEDCVDHMKKGFAGFRAYEKSRDRWKGDLPGSKKIRDAFSSLEKTTNSYISTASLLQVDTMCGESFEIRKGIVEQLSVLYEQHAKLADLLSSQLIYENAKYHKEVVEMDDQILKSIEKMILLGTVGLVFIGVIAVRLSFRVGRETSAIQSKTEEVASGNLTVEF